MTKPQPITPKPSPCMGWDHSLAEKIAKEVGNDMFVCWWTYEANYIEPKVVIAHNMLQAFERAFPFQNNLTDPKFRKFVIQVRRGSDATEIIDGKPESIGSRIQASRVFT